jgi:hypothetical protein
MTTMAFPAEWARSFSARGIAIGLLVSAAAIWIVKVTKSTSAAQVPAH